MVPFSQHCCSGSKFPKMWWLLLCQLELQWMLNISPHMCIYLSIHTYSTLEGALRFHGAHMVDWKPLLNFCLVVV